MLMVTMANFARSCPFSGVNAHTDCMQEGAASLSSALDEEALVGFQSAKVGLKLARSGVSSGVTLKTKSMRE